MITLENIKNLDAGKIMQVALQKKDLLAQVAVVVISAIALVSMVTNPQKQEYRQEIQDLKEKLDVMRLYDQGLKNSKLFLAGLPKGLSEEDFSSNILDYASRNHISILSFSPGSGKEEGLSKLATLQISVHAGTYKDFLAFVNAIEEAPFALRIDSCTLSGREEKGIDAQMVIASVGVKT